jgi:nitroreductase
MEQPLLFETIDNMRAMRRLKTDAVPLEMVDRILESATKAPSGGNRQPWNFLAIVDPQVRAAMGEIYRKAWDDYFEPTRRATAGQTLDPTTQRMFDSAEYLGAHFGDSPVIILVLRRDMGPPEEYPAGVAGQYAAIYPAVENILLSARGLGLGATLTTLHRERAGEVRALLGVPEDVDICACIPIGYPQGKFGPVRRRPIEEVAFRDRWGEPWQRAR